ncbi:uncharacterized protein [Chlorocebus sabaeus]|uniref:uncharacterized protein n=1 Tax=Chlorocebus sabaeus TaxID=60711 RepID=UPI003BF9BCCA
MLPRTSNAAPPAGTPPTCGATPASATSPTASAAPTYDDPRVGPPAHTRPRPAPVPFSALFPAPAPSRAPTPTAPPVRLGPARHRLLALGLGGGAGGAAFPGRARAGRVSIACCAPGLAAPLGLLALDADDSRAPKGSLRKFLEHLSGAGKAIGVLTSGGDAQDGVSFCHPDWSTVARPWLTATSTACAQVILLLQPPNYVHTEAVWAALAKHKEWKMAVPMPSKRRSLVVQTSMDAYTLPGLSSQRT